MDLIKPDKYTHHSDMDLSYFNVLFFHLDYKTVCDGLEMVAQVSYIEDFFYSERKLMEDWI